jgi:sortase (surface protein transpeptidase)
LKKGDRALIVDFNAGTGVYEVEPVDWLLPEEIQALDDPQRAAQVISSRIRHR